VHVALCATLRRTAADAKLQAAACLLLSRILLHTPAVAAAASDAGGVEAALAAHRVHAGSFEVQACSLRLLMALLAGAPANRDRAERAGALDVILTSLRQSERLDVQLRALEALTSMLKDAPLARGVAIVAAGAPEAVVAAMRAHAGGFSTQSHACRVLLLLVKATPEAAEAAGDAGAVDTILAALRRPEADVTMVRGGWQAINHVVCKTANQHRLVAAGGVTDLLRVLQGERIDVPTYVAACCAFVYVLETSDGDAEAHAQGAPAIVCAALDLLRQYAPLALSLVHVAETMVRVNAACAAEVLRCGACEAVKQAAKMHPGKPMEDFASTVMRAQRQRLRGATPAAALSPNAAAAAALAADAAAAALLAEEEAERAAANAPAKGKSNEKQKEEEQQGHRCRR
jgi:hypothetical protein